MLSTNKWYRLLFGLLFLQVSNVFSQNEAGINSSERVVVDTSYIESYYDRLGVRFYEINKLNQIKFSNNKTGHSIIYKPNDVNALGLAVNYRWFSLGMAVPILP